MKNKKAFKYLAYSLLLYGVFFGGELLLYHLRKVYSVTFEGAFLGFGVMTLTPLLMGLLLGIESSLMAASKQKGFWKINWYRLFILGVPALIIIVNFVLGLLGISTPMYKFSQWPILIKPEFIRLSSLILGYVLGSSFFKENHLIQVEEK